MKINYNNSTIENEDLNKEVETNTPLKEWVVNYVGEKANPVDDNITTQMIIDVFAHEFPEFLMAVAEENFVRGYEQATSDWQSFPDHEACGNEEILKIRPPDEDAGFDE